MAKENVSQMRVCIRVRPPNLKELEAKDKDVVRVVDENFLVFDPKDDDAPEFYKGQRRRLRDMTKRRCKDMKFAFDNVFGPDVTQEHVYEKSTKDMVDVLISGFNCTVFAYGATGAGKTFTMLGAMDKPGVMYHTMRALYARIEEENNQTYSIAISYLEVYNEKIHDLLMPGKDLRLCEDPKKGTIVSSLSLHQPQSADELMRMLATGNMNRTQHPTDANKQSSRSHAVFQVFLRQKNSTASMSEQYAVSKMSLIDLAGSERATVTSNRGARFREGANINKSLLALGNCINALADPKHKGHIPYRNSKLTRLLKDSLGGNCRTVMIAAISPSMTSYEDTYSTLRYADRAKNIRSSLHKNIVNVELHVSRYAAVVEKLKKENALLKSKLSKYESGVLQPTAKRTSVNHQTTSHASTNQSSSRVSTTVATKTPEDIIQQYQATLESIFSEKQICDGELLKAASEMKVLEFATERRKEEVSRINIFTNPNVKEKATCRMERVMAANQARQLHKMNRIEAARLKHDQTMDKIKKIKTEMNSLNGAKEVMPRELALCLRMQELSSEIGCLESKNKHVLKVALKTEAALQNNDRLILSLLKFTKKQFYLLKDRDMLSSDMEKEFDKLQKQVEGAKEVAWADEQNSVLESTDSEAEMPSHALSLPLYDLPKFDPVPSNPTEYLQLCSIHPSNFKNVKSEVEQKQEVVFKPPPSATKPKPRSRQLFKRPESEQKSSSPPRKRTLKSTRSMTSLRTTTAAKRLNSSDEIPAQTNRKRRSRNENETPSSKKSKTEKITTSGKPVNGETSAGTSVKPEGNNEDENINHIEESSNDIDTSTTVLSNIPENHDTAEIFEHGIAEISHHDRAEILNHDKADIPEHELNSTFTISSSKDNTSPDSRAVLGNITSNIENCDSKITSSAKLYRKRKHNKNSLAVSGKKHFSAAQTKISAEIQRLGISSVVMTMGALPGFMKPTATSRAKAIKNEIENINNKPNRRKKLHRRSKSLTSLALSYK